MAFTAPWEQNETFNSDYNKVRVMINEISERIVCFCPPRELDFEKAKTNVDKCNLMFHLNSCTSKMEKFASTTRLE